MPEQRTSIAAVPVPPGLTAIYLPHGEPETVECRVAALVVVQRDNDISICAYVIDTLDIHPDNYPIERADRVKGGALLDISVKNTTFSRSDAVAFIKLISDIALGSSDLVASHWLPRGVKKGNEWWAFNPKYTDEKQFFVHVDLDTGRWGDPLTANEGMNLVSLVAWLEGCTRLEAAEAIAEYLEVGPHAKE